MGVLPVFLKYLTSILQTIFNMLFFLTDHRVCLGQLGVIDRKNVTKFYGKSMKFYLLQNIFGVIHNLLSMGV